MFDRKKYSEEMNGTFQSAGTFLSISLISSVGERMAARMKISLFASIISQDLAFFDKVRTGELIDW